MQEVIRDNSAPSLSLSWRLESESSHREYYIATLLPELQSLLKIFRKNK